MKFKSAFIGDHVQKIKKWNPSRDIPNDDFFYIDLSSINKNAKCLVPELIQKTVSKEAPSRARQRVELNDVLVATVRPNLNGVALVDRHFPNATASTGYCVLRPSDSLYHNYLFYWVRSKSFIDDMIKKSTGASYPAVSDKIIKGSKIPLPPLPEQKKIAAILDAADAYRQKTKALIAKYEELSQSLFLEMFGDPVLNPMGWETQTIEHIAENKKWSIKRGPFGGALKKEIFVEDGYLVYEQYHALNNDFNFARYFITQSKFEELKAFQVSPGDIIISCSGVYLGKLAIIPENARKGIINQALLKISLNQSKMTNRFFTFHFRQPNFRSTFFGANRGAGIPNFPPMKDFKTFPFIVPPIEMQNKFEVRIQSIASQKAQAQASLLQADNLFNSLLQKAFKGELTGRVQV